MTTWLDTVRALPTLTLGEVEEQAALQTRVDRKYVVTAAAWGNALASLGHEPRVLHIEGRRSFRYSSTYYDTADLDSYRDAARGRPHRYKVRTRRYLDTGGSAIEVKMRSASGTTVKSRQWLDASTVPDGNLLPAEAATFVGGFDRIGEAAYRMSEVLTTSYHRVTLVTDDARVTVDRQVTATDCRGRHMDYGDLLIVESKAAGAAGAADRALWASGSRPSRISKYGTSLAVLRPELPSNRWSRAIRRDLPAPAPLAAV
ncbi:polyphosphate polymerase domain-containing protein [Aeromicrobium sp. Sec7.5]|uniref:polyphosphate polymerase domain-containing protein n=1 Tax=Aeromicrobium sp. Sec7.5 TaxID=3121276 RepID=UPI002FE4F132